MRATYIAPYMIRILYPSRHIHIIRFDTRVFPHKTAAEQRKGSSCRKMLERTVKVDKLNYPILDKVYLLGVTVE